MEKITFVLSLNNAFNATYIDGGFKINGKNVPFERISKENKRIFARAAASACAHMIEVLKDDE